MATIGSSFVVLNMWEKYVLYRGMRQSINRLITPDTPYVITLFLKLWTLVAGASGSDLSNILFAVEVNDLRVYSIPIQKLSAQASCGTGSAQA